MKNARRIIINVFCVILIIFCIFALYLMLAHYPVLKEVRRINDINYFFKFGEMECTQTDTNDDGLKTTYNAYAKYSFGELENATFEIITEVEPEYIDFTYEFMKTTYGSLEKYDGIDISIEKKDSHVDYLMKINYKELDPLEFENIDNGNVSNLTYRSFKNSMKSYQCTIK